MPVTSKQRMAEIFTKHSDFVYRTAYFLTKSKVMAEDITQETFIRMIKKYHLYDPSKPIKPWIYQIALNITRNMMRKQKLLSFVGITTEMSQQEMVERQVMKNEQEEELWKEINRLTKKSKELIVLHFYSGLTLVEVSQALNIPVGTCKSRLNYALTKLRKNMPEHDLFKNNEFRGGSLDAKKS